MWYGVERSSGTFLRKLSNGGSPIWIQFLADFSLIERPETEEGKPGVYLEPFLTALATAEAGKYLAVLLDLFSIGGGSI